MKLQNAKILVRKNAIIEFTQGPNQLTGTVVSNDNGLILVKTPGSKQSFYVHPENIKKVKGKA